MKYIKTYFAFICSFLLMFSSLLSPVVRASEMEKSASNIRKESTVEVVEGSTGNLFEEVNSIHSGIVHTFVDGDFLITELLGEDDTVLVTKVINQKTGETLTTTSSSEATVVIEKTTINDNEYASEREIYNALSPEQEDMIFDNQRSVFKSLGGGWQYTGLALGIHLFATLVDLSMGALIGSLAAIFNISAWLVTGLLTFMGAYGLFGMQLAHALDTNGNGWVALYKKRSPYYPYNYSHRTY